jgi:STE24 endopeptidase
MEQASIYASIVFFLLFYSPIEMILSVAMNHLSRQYEYEADAFAAETIDSVNAMIVALKNLSLSNLSNLTPHRLNVWFNYSHPPVLERITALRLMAD